jgi:hypothetical protein
MSIKAIQWAVSGDTPTTDVSEVSVLITLACEAGEDGCSVAQLTRGQIAAQSKVSLKTVARRLKSMTERGLIKLGAPGAYDLMIPYSWFPDIDHVNEKRQRAGKPPLTPMNRPDLCAGPSRARRKDAVQDGRQRADIPNAVRAAVFKRDGHACRKCGSAYDLTIDHILPWSLGGPDTADNLRVLCRSCNSRKRDRIESVGGGS